MTKVARWGEGTLHPPEDKGHRIEIGYPARNLTQEELERWAEHLRRGARHLEQEKKSVQAIDQRYRDDRWKLENHIRGLEATCKWQASVIGEDKPVLRLAVEQVKEILEYIPYEIPSKVRTDMDRGGLKKWRRLPFFTEAFLYPLLGKEEARSLLARASRTAESVGLSLRDIVGGLFDENGVLTKES
jgi:hypothetical protein